jgi:transcription elongation factor GreA
MDKRRDNQIPLTRAGYAEKEARLHYLITERRQEVAEYLHETETPDWEDHSAHDDARAEQARLESEIHDLQEILAHAVLLDPLEEQAHTPGPSRVTLGSSVTVQTPHGTKTVTIVSTVEADSTQQKISDQSPVGRALLGHATGERVEVDTPSGPAGYTIVSISS